MGSGVLGLEKLGSGGLESGGWGQIIWGWGVTELWLGVGSEKLGRGVKSGEFRVGRVGIKELALRGLRTRVGIRGTGIGEVGVGKVVVGG